MAPCDVVQPDLLFVSRARERTITDENVRGAPDLVIEILSPATAERDVGCKHELYGRHGVREFHRARTRGIRTTTASTLAAACLAGTAVSATVERGRGAQGCENDA